jgi:hypothetical protein
LADNAGRATAWLAHHVVAERQAIAGIERLQEYDLARGLAALVDGRKPHSLETWIYRRKPHLRGEAPPVSALHGPEGVDRSDAGAQQRFVGEQTIADCGLNVGREELQLGACLLLFAIDGAARRDPGQHETSDQDSETE